MSENNENANEVPKSEARTEGTEGKSEKSGKSGKSGKDGAAPASGADGAPSPVADESPVEAKSTGGGGGEGADGEAGEAGGAEAGASAEQVEPDASKVKSGLAKESAVKSGVKSGVAEAVVKSAAKKSSSGSGSGAKRGSASKTSSSTGGSKVSAKPSRSRSKAVASLEGARIGFIGAGRMTDSLVKGLLKSEKVKPKQVFIAAKTAKNFDAFKVQGITTSTRAYDIFGKFDCDVVIMAVHGFVIRNCFKLGGSRPLALTTNFIPTRRRAIYVLSLIGGVPLADLKQVLLNPDSEGRYKVAMHRLVLNTSVAYGLGLGALDVELDSKKCAPVVRDLLQAVAKVEYVVAEQMDAVCSLAGNGSAFVYYFIASLADGGFKMGLNKVMAVKLATKTMQSAALAVLETNKGPAALRDASTSPSGPAIYGIAVLDKQDCASGLQAAIEGANRRLKELVEKAV